MGKVQRQARRGGSLERRRGKAGSSHKKQKRRILVLDSTASELGGAPGPGMGIVQTAASCGQLRGTDSLEPGERGGQLARRADISGLKQHKTNTQRGGLGKRSVECGMGKWGNGGMGGRT